MKWAYVSCLVVVLSFCTRAADELKVIEAKMKSGWEGLKSIAYDNTMKMESSSPQYSTKSDTTGTLEMVRIDKDNWKMRSEGKSASVNKIAGQPEQTDNSTSLSIMDGQNMYSYTESSQAKYAMKMKMPKDKVQSGEFFFDNLKDHDVKVLADETVDGEACWVVQTISKKTPEDPNQVTTKYYITKSHGMMILTETKGPQMTMTNKITNIKYNPSIADSRFVFTAPPGVTVVDADAANAAAQQQAAAAQAQAAEAQKKAEEEEKKNETAAAKKEEEPAKKEEPATAKKEEEPKKKEEKTDTKKKIKKGFGF